MKKIEILFVVLGIFLIVLGRAKQEKIDVQPKVEPQSPVVKETVKEEPTKAETAKTEETTKEETTGAMNVINVVGDNFEPSELTIKVGEKVTWKNMREGNVKNMLIKGTKNCVKVQSRTLKPGETFEWTFTESGKCEYIDAITSLKVGKVIIEG